MGPKLVRARIMPLMTTVGAQHQFSLGQSQLTGYDVIVSQSHRKSSWRLVKQASSVA
jgi:hypothetical protein